MQSAWLTLGEVAEVVKDALRQHMNLHIESKNKVSYRIIKDQIIIELAFKRKIEEYKNGDSDDTIGLFSIINWIEHNLKPKTDNELESLTLEFIKNMLAEGFQRVILNTLRLVISLGKIKVLAM